MLRGRQEWWISSCHPLIISKTQELSCILGTSVINWGESFHIIFIMFSLSPSLTLFNFTKLNFSFILQ